MKTVLVALSAASFLVTSAHAAVDPQRVPGGDPRVRTVAYNPKQMVNIASTGLEPLHLVLQEGEIPKSVDGLNVFFVHPKDDGTEPDRSAWPALRWEARRSGNVVALQPFGMMQPTIMFLRTVSAEGETRHYANILTTRDGEVASGNDPMAYVEVDWAYKRVASPEEIAAAQARRDAQAASWSERKARVLLNQAMAAPQAVNRDYWKDPVEDEHRKCSELFPKDIFDNGHDTTLVFPPHALLPVISALNQDNKRADISPLPETTTEGVRVVLPATYKQLNLARGGKVCGVLNHAYDKIGTMLGGGTGTVSPDVVRTVRIRR